MKFDSYLKYLKHVEVKHFFPKLRREWAFYFSDVIAVIGNSLYCTQMKMIIFS